MKMKLSFLLLVCLMASGSYATWNWEGDVSSSWADAANWNDGTASPPDTVPHTAGESMYIAKTSNSVVNADMSDTMGILMMSRGGSATGGTTLNINNSEVVLTVTKSSGELVSVCYEDNSSGNLNVSAGRLNVYRGTGAGELRLNHVYSTACVGNLNLSGTGVVDVEYLNKGDRAAGGNFYATGGTLKVRNIINKFGLVADGYTGFRLGGACLEMASYSDRNNEIGNVLLGSGQNMDFIMDSTSKVLFDLGLAGNKGGAAGTNWDLLQSRGNYTIDGQLLVNFLIAPEIGDYWDVWKIQSGYENTYSGSGLFDNLPTNIKAEWIDSGAGTDTLRLTCIPEPITMVLFGLGLLAMRRK